MPRSVRGVCTATCAAAAVPILFISRLWHAASFSISSADPRGIARGSSGGNAAAITSLKTTNDNEFIIKQERETRQDARNNGCLLWRRQNRWLFLISKEDVSNGFAAPIGCRSDNDDCLRTAINGNNSTLSRLHLVCRDHHEITVITACTACAFFDSPFVGLLHLDHTRELGKVR